jgi:hypothetical protein
MCGESSFFSLIKTENSSLSYEKVLIFAISISLQVKVFRKYVS